MDLKGLKVTVVGIARSGTSAALLLARLGARVHATDSGNGGDIEKNAATLKAAGICCQIGGHTESFIKGRDLIVVSPGVNKNASVISRAKEERIPVIGELELGYLFCKGRIIAVTGTNGKTTTASLIGHMIEKAGRPVAVCGNIGAPLCERIPDITSGHFVVLEVSSFQLEWIDRFKPYISVILNITNDHLDRHAGFDEYADLKSRIAANQDEGDFLILNHEDPVLKNLRVSGTPRRLFFSRRREVEGSFVKNDEVFVNIGGNITSACHAGLIPLKGMHNLDNVAASALACRLAGLPDDDIEGGISSFSPPAHRFQTVAKIRGVEFINDSKATNVDATLQALLSLKAPAVLIAGGRDKEGDFSLIRGLVKEKVRHLILIGEAKDKIASHMRGVAAINDAASLREAVRMGFELAKDGDVVLFSPMCASFDMFKDYAERGRVFTEAVEGLKEKLCTASDSRF